MTVLGIGPAIAIAAVIGLALVLVCHYMFGLAFSLPAPWQQILMGLGIVCLIVGAFFWLTGAFLVERAFKAHKLVVSGVFRFSRNPLYAAFIVFIVPGISFILNDLMVLLISVSMFIMFKAQIHKEEDYLGQEFGDEFRNYARGVAQLIPFVRV